MAGSARAGSGHRAGGANLASGVDAAGTVARIDLRVLCPPTQMKLPLLPTVRPLSSIPGKRGGRSLQRPV